MQIVILAIPTDDVVNPIDIPVDPPAPIQGNILNLCWNWTLNIYY